jgi:hypothetical protein
VRHERRLKSVKCTPKVVYPLSDRKLPKVFKMAGGDLPPISKMPK